GAAIILRIYCRHHSNQQALADKGKYDMRQISLVGFLQAQNCTTFPGSWRHPEARSDSWSPEYYQHIARVLEEGKFDLGFFDDRLSMPDMYGRDHAHT